VVRLKGLAEELRKKKVAEKADVRIGKAGLHEGIIKEIERRLKEHRAVKIKLLRSARDKVTDKDIIELAKKLDAIVADIRGYTYVLISRKLKSE
jgi:RNA-binding protein